MGSRRKMVCSIRNVLIVLVPKMYEQIKKVAADLGHFAREPYKGVDAIECIDDMKSKWS